MVGVMIAGSPLGGDLARGLSSADWYATRRLMARATHDDTKHKG